MNQTLNGSNPFSTRWTQPGSLSFDFQHQPFQLSDLLQPIKRPGFRGAIVGPHGCGKTTLLNCIEDQLAEEGWTVQRVVIRGWEPLPTLDWQAGSVERSVLIIDGFEQYRWWRKRWVGYKARLKKLRLLVTTHRPCFLPTLVQVSPTLEAFQAIVQKLTGSVSVPTDIVREAFLSEQENMREALFRLYDWWEAKRVRESDS